MRNETLDRILAAAKPGLAAHWSSCIEHGLTGFSLAATGQVDGCIEAYFKRLKALPEPAAKPAILEEIKALFGALDRVNAGAGGGLLETDERELLVPLVIDAAVAAGLDPAGFEDGDPTLAFRTF